MNREGQKGIHMSNIDIEMTVGLWRCGYVVNLDPTEENIISAAKKYCEQIENLQYLGSQVMIWQQKWNPELIAVYEYHTARLKWV